jgi:quinol-cytochrome oxidoreductase complex cytochrome b subunit
MKKLLVSVFLVFFAGFTIFANDADLFKLDYNAVHSEFTQLNQLATMVTSNSDLTYSMLKLSDGNLIESLRLVPESALPGGEKNPVLGIPSFLWGCGLGVVGMLVVYIVSDKDKEETKKAMWGCITWTAVVVVVDVIWWGALWGASNGI